MTTDDHDPLADFTGPARLFPLPNVVLYPHIMQGLHIFEPRYRQMTADALAGDRLIAMVLLQPGWDSDVGCAPSLHRVACLGRIDAEHQLPDGRYNLQLRGLARARIRREVSSDKLYRSAEVEILRDIDIDDEIQHAELRENVRAVAETWWPSHGDAPAMLARLMESDISMGTLCDVIAYALTLPMEFKQTLLETLDVVERARLLMNHLHEFSPEPSSSVQRAFPPQFSVN